MTAAAPARMHHVALTVRDLEASRDWYEQVFGLKYVMDAPHEGGFAQLLAAEDFSLVIVLHRHDAHAGDTFLESRTGLDHLGLAVPTRDDLVAWQAHLESHGVARAEAADRPLTQSAIADESYGSVLVFRDPDNIQLELFAAPSA
ncbi:MAG TPA: VOC family protein [Mycobacteriales bacterium]|nr:VOC family protein [Mycobacteriales bacterium]